MDDSVENSVALRNAPGCRAAHALERATGARLTEQLLSPASEGTMKKRILIFLAPFIAASALGALYLFLSWALNAGPSIRYAVGATAIATMISIWWWAAGELMSSDPGSDTATEPQSADRCASSAASLEQPHAGARTA